jgi:hypothetical protein
MRPEHGTPYIDTPMNREFAGGPPAPGTAWWSPPAPWDVARDLWRWAAGDTAAAAPAQRQGQTITVTGNPITINITAPSADPAAIGAAAGNAVGSALRGVMGDTPPDLGRMAVP